MASLDVFTNIPLEETIDICVELVFDNENVVRGLNRNEFRTLLSLVTKESFILFNGTYYKQINGVAMAMAHHLALRLPIFFCAIMKKNGLRRVQQTSDQLSTAAT